jgi:hypothetical protein
MALLRINPKTTELEVLVGVLEQYKPDKEIRAINKALTELKSKVEVKAKQLFGEGLTPQEMVKKSLEDKELGEQFSTYLDSEYRPELELLLTRISNKNKKMCPGYSEHINPKE